MIQVLLLLIMVVGCGKKAETTLVEKAMIIESDHQFFTQKPSWQGSSQITADQNLDFLVHFNVSDGQVGGTISIPLQNAIDIPLDDIRLEDGTLHFILKPPKVSEKMWAVYSFPSALIKSDLVGVLQQGGQTFPTTLKIGETPVLARPQTPKPPFPYTEQEISYSNPNDDAVLVGTLTLPEGEGPHPVVLMITGSGSQDRDETIFGHKSFWVIADHLTRRGIAVLRVDDRGVGDSTGAGPDLTTLTFAEDVAAGLMFLKEHPQIDPSKMGLIGHSEGGLIAPIVASQQKEVAFIVLLAGTGVNGLETMVRQNYDIFKAAGASEAFLQRYIEVYRKAWDPALPSEDAESVLGQFLDVQLEFSGETLPEEVRAQTIQDLHTVKENAWMKTFLTLEPTEYLSKVTCPVLAMNGTLDLQVAHDQHLPVIEKTLLEAGNKQVRIESLDGLNHLFQLAKTGEISEYATIEESFNEEALKILSDWLVEQSNAKSPY